MHSMLSQPLIKNMEVIRSDRFIIYFENNILNDSALRIFQKIITFNVNVENNKILIFDEVNNIIKNKNKLNAIISCFDTHGELLIILFLVNVNFLKIKNFINFEYGGSGNTIIDLSVKYKYEEIKTFSNFEQLKKYQRKQKLEFLNKMRI